jgi:protein-disulfide isomerase
MDTERERDATTEPVELVIGLRQALLVLVVLAAVIFAVGFGAWTLATMTGVPEVAFNLLAEPRDTTPTQGQEVPQAAVPPTPSVTPIRRQMALPPVRKGYVPQTEATSVKGDPSAPVIIVEFSDYQ